MIDKWRSVPFHKAVWYAVFGVAGLLLGLLIGGAFGGGAKAPTTFSEDDRGTWIQMTAESFSQNRDVEMARQRLNRLVAAGSSWKQVAASIERKAAALESDGNDLGAQQLRQMSAALNLPRSDAPEVDTSAQRRVEFWRILLFIGLVLLFLALVAFVLWRMALASLKRIQEQEPPEETPEAFPDGSADSRQQSEPFDGPPDHALSGHAAEQYKSFEPIEELDAEPRRTMPTPAFQAPTPRLNVRNEQDAQAEEYEEAGVLGSFEAEYTFGIDDYDCSFTISTPEGVFLGDCGVGASDVLPAIGPQHVDALEVWLFDKGDVSSVSKFLVSEYAYENPALNNRLSAKGELVLAEPGALLTLETRSLRITAQVLAVEYDTEVDPNRSYFRRVSVEITAELAE